MTEPTVTCPKCKTEIKLTESLAGPLLDSTRQDYEARLAQKDTAIATRENELRQKEEAVAKARESIENQVAEKLKAERAKISADEAKNDRTGHAGHRWDVWRHAGHCGEDFAGNRGARNQDLGKRRSGRMKIKSLTVSNFRSLRNVTIEVAAFNVFVGQNNHGKTNLFQAVDWFYSGRGDLADIRYADAASDQEIIVEVEFTGVQEGIARISNAENQTKLKNILGNSDTMRVRRTSTAPKERSLFHPASDQWKKQPTGADSAFNNCIPRFEFVETSKNLKEVSAYKSTTPIGQMLGAVIAEQLAKDVSYEAFHKAFDGFFQGSDSGVRKTLNDLSQKVCRHLALQFPECSGVSFEIVEPSLEEFLKTYKTRVNDGVETSAEEKGDGMQRALMLAIIKGSSPIIVGSRGKW